MAGAGGVYVGGGATVVMEPPSVIYVEVFRENSGPDQHIKRKANDVASFARFLAPFRTGELRASIHVSQNRDHKNQFAFGYSVSANTSYAFYVHDGTGPSPRWPSTRNSMRWMGREGAPVYRDFVMHPGTPAQPFLRAALVAMVR